MPTQCPEINFKDPLEIIKKSTISPNNEVIRFKRETQRFDEMTSRNSAPALIEKLQSETISEGDYEIFKKNSRSFEAVWRKHEEGILTKVSNYIGREWLEKEITVYPFSSKIKIPSRAYPLLLKISEDINFDIYLLTHELCHRYVGENSKLWESMKSSGLRWEPLAEYISLEVMKETFGTTESERLHRKEMELIKTRDMEVSSREVEDYQSKYDLRKSSLYEQTRCREK